MGKRLHAKQFNGITFGMEIDTDTTAYKILRKAIKWDENCLSCLDGTSLCKSWVVPYKALANCMREAHWLVDENKSFDYVTIQGLAENDRIYINYSDGQMNFKHRF